MPSILRVELSPSEAFQSLMEAGTRLHRLPTLAEVTDAVAFLASDQAGAMTGTVANLSAGAIVDSEPGEPSGAVDARRRRR